MPKVKAQHDHNTTRIEVHGTHIFSVNKEKWEPTPFKQQKVVLDRGGHKLLHKGVKIFLVGT